MSRLPITVATWDYDRVRALTDGRVAIGTCAKGRPVPPHRASARATAQ